MKTQGLLTTEELAERLGIKPGTILHEKWATKGSFRGFQPIRHARRLWWPPEAAAFPTKPDPDAYYTTAQAAARLGMQPATLLVAGERGGGNYRGVTPQRWRKALYWPVKGIEEVLARNVTLRALRSSPVR